MSGSEPKRLLVTGGAGYVGAVLVPELLEAGHEVRVLDLFLYGEDVLDAVAGHPKLSRIKGDLRDASCVEEAVRGTDAVLHLACVSNDPSYELDPELSRSINHHATVLLVDEARRQGVRRFVYASSSSVYGVKDEEQVTEELPLEPLTDYSKFKALCEEICLERASGDFVVTVLRPATVCGYSPRQRLDVIVNILTNFAVNQGKIRVFGGEQYRPNIHIRDMTRLYRHVLDLPEERVQRGIYNAGYENLTVNELAELVKSVVGPQLLVERLPTDDPRSYRINSDKIRRELGFEPRHTIRDAIVEMVEAFRAGKLPDSMTDTRYFNVRRMQELDLRRPLPATVLEARDELRAPAA